MIQRYVRGSLADFQDNLLDWIDLAHNGYGMSSTDWRTVRASRGPRPVHLFRQVHCVNVIFVCKKQGSNLASRIIRATEWVPCLSGYPSSAVHAHSCTACATVDV